MSVKGFRRKLPATGATGLYIGAQDMVSSGAASSGRRVAGEKNTFKRMVLMAIDREYELHPYAEGGMRG